MARGPSGQGHRLEYLCHHPWPQQSPSEARLCLVRLGGLERTFSISEGAPNERAVSPLVQGGTQWRGCQQRTAVLHGGLWDGVVETWLPGMSLEEDTSACFVSLSP